MEQSSWGKQFLKSLKMLFSKGCKCCIWRWFSDHITKDTDTLRAVLFNSQLWPSLPFSWMSMLVLLLVYHTYDVCNTYVFLNVVFIATARNWDSTALSDCSSLSLVACFVLPRSRGTVGRHRHRLQIRDGATYSELPWLLLAWYLFWV